jgi:glycosyltransferase involved in cell wall biosynthesis
LCHVYNQRAYVEDALDGILCQATDFPFELIVRDDASSDGTTQVVAAYAERYPRIVRAVLEPENRYRQGVKPIAATFPLARGEFVAFCEGDDYWLGQDKLQQQVDYMRAHPDCGRVHGNYLNLIKIAGHWRTRVALRSSRQLQHRTGALYAAMLQANRIQTCTVLCRRSLVAAYRQSGPGVDGYMVGDWPLFLSLSRAARVSFIERPIAAYRRTPGSMMNSGRDAAVARGVDAIRMVGEFCDYFNDGEAIRNRALAAQYRVLLWLVFRAGDVRRFDHAWQWLAAHQPVAQRPLRARAMRALIGHDAARRVVLQVLAELEAIKHWLEFHSVDAGSEKDAGREEAAL